MGLLVVQYGLFKLMEDQPQLFPEQLSPSIAHAAVFILGTLILLVVVKARGGRWFSLGIRADELGPDLKWTLLAALVLIPVYGLLLGLAVGGVYLFADDPQRLLQERLQGAFFADYGAWSMLRVLLIYPVLEELWYRGLLYTPLRRERGRTIAILLTTLIFAFSHGMFPVTQLLGGIIFAFAYEARRGLVAPILLHFAGNGSLALAGFLIARWNLLA